MKVKIFAGIVAAIVVAVAAESAEGYRKSRRQTDARPVSSLDRQGMNC
jgi:hypothetical protein